MPVDIAHPPVDDTTTHKLMISIINLYEDQANSEPLYAEIVLHGDVLEEMHCHRFTRENEKIIVDFSQPGLYIPFENFPNFTCLDSQTEEVIASVEITAENQIVLSDGLSLRDLAAVTVVNGAIKKATSFPNEGIQYGLRTTGHTLSDEYDNESALDFFKRVGVPKLIDNNLGL